MQKRIFALFWHTAMRSPWRTFIAIINTVLTVFIGAFVGPFIVAQILEKLQSGSLTLDSSWPLIALFALTQLYGEVIGWRITLYAMWTMETIGDRYLYEKVFGHLSAQSLSFHANQFGGSLVSQTNKLTSAFEKFWSTIFFQVISVAVSIVATVTILGFLFWQYAIFVGVMSVFFAAFVVVTSRHMAALARKESQASTAMSGRLADVIGNILTVKSSGAEKREKREAAELARTWGDRSLDTMRGFLKVSTGYSGLIVTMNVIALIAAVWGSQHHIASLGVMYLALTYTLTVTRQLWEINSIMRNYNSILGDAHDMTKILDQTPEVQDMSTKKLRVSNGAVTFDKVAFTHDGEDIATLFQDFTLTIPAGQKVGLVGHSGSGKTTLTRLLLRFSDIESGTIAIDSTDINSVTQASLRQNIAYVPQEPLLFHRSLRENIAYGRPNATEKEIYQAAKQAHALEFIEALPQKFDTMVGERGVKLSGGQRQRIAIARAILKNAPILVLDEATSALDSESERLIQDALGKLMKGRTSIVIAHRLSTIAKLDRIVVLDHGRITEDGTHAELLQKQGTYAGLWAHQSGGFIEE